jgi:hypothetical protein
MTELGVLTNRAAEELNALIDPAALAAAIPAKLCGDEAACASVRTMLQDDHDTHLQVVDSSAWSLERLNVDTAARDLSARERASVKGMSRVVVVHVNGATSKKQIPLRAALAATAYLSDKIGGLVWDQLLDRVENARGFAGHVVTTPLDQPCFRRDRIELLYEPKGEGVVRLLTSGLSRWGVADVEVQSVPSAAAERVADVALGVAAALANGTVTASPATLTLDDLAAARGQAYPADAGLPASAPVTIDLSSVHPETGDPNDFIVRIDTGDADGPVAAMSLAEKFFGPMLAAAPADDVVAQRRAKAQAGYASALARWTAGRSAGARLTVQVPFSIPGSDGAESMWILVTRADAQNVTGTVLDEPLAATDVHKGDEVTRPRSDVEDLSLQMPKP